MPLGLSFHLRMRIRPYSIRNRYSGGWRVVNFAPTWLLLSYIGELRMQHLRSALLAVGICFAFALALQAQNYVCTVYQRPPGQNTRYVLAPSDELMRGTLAIFEDAACQTQTDSVEAPVRGWAYAGTRDAAEALCRSDVAGLSSSNRSLWRCLSGGRRGLSSNLLRPARPTGETLMQGSLLRLSAVQGLDSGIHYQRVREGGIGQAGDHPSRLVGCR